MKEVADNIDAGNTNLSEEESMDILRAIAHQRMSKEDACDFVHLQRSRFDDLVRLGLLPKGRKTRGSANLFWYKDELIDAITKDKYKQFDRD